MRASKQPYAGIDKAIDGGMTAAVHNYHDARAFGIIPQTETCDGWSTSLDDND